MKTLVIVLAVIIVILLGVLIFIKPAQGPTVPVVSSDGHLAITMPQANELVLSPITIKGTVTGGGWFFEASFPVKVLDGDGAVLGQGVAQAQPPESWMSTGTVPFSATIDFAAPKYATGTIVLAKDNPSGDPQNALELNIPVRFDVATDTAGAGIRGEALLGPTCPVERNPPDPQCADKPYAGTLAVTTADGSRVVAQFNTDASGTYRVQVPPGAYAIRNAPSASSLPRCASNGTITVVAGAYTDAAVSCDTGIR